METINDETIKYILSDKFSEEHWLFVLSNLEWTNATLSEADHYMMSSFLEQGKVIWNKYKEKLQDIICDKDKKEPKENIQELTSGNIKDLIVNIITLLTTTYSVSLAVAIPLCALALKKGINNICKEC